MADEKQPHAHVLMTVSEAEAEADELAAGVERLSVAPAVQEGGWEFGVPGWVRSSAGGLKCVDTEEMDRQKGVLTHLIKTAGSRLLQGKSAVNISLPVRIFEPRSFLQRIPDSWCFAPVLLTRAALAKDPLERFQWVVAFAVSGLHRSSTNLKPFNPILGETFQGRYVDGTEVLLEQVSHHPPVSEFQMIGPRGAYHMHGYHEFAATFRPNSLLGQQIGPNTVSFPDGTNVVYKLPHALISGTLMGERNFQWFGTMTFSDERNNLHLDLAFNPDAKSAISRFFSSQKSPSDAVRGSVHRRHNVRPSPKSPDKRVWDEEALSECTGSWMDGVEFDGKPFWTKQSLPMFEPEPVPEEEALPSDCRYREDVQRLKEGDEKAAQEWKQTLEDRQRRDRKLRENASKVRSRIAKLQAKSSQRRLSRDADAPAE